MKTLYFIFKSGLITLPIMQQIWRDRKFSTRIFFMKIKDKNLIAKKRFCPPHFFPHKFKFWEKITNEPCHTHKRKWRMAHHKFFCKYLKCKNYNFMIKKNKAI